MKAGMHAREMSVSPKKYQESDPFPAFMTPGILPPLLYSCPQHYPFMTASAQKTLPKLEISAGEGTGPGNLETCI